MTRCRLTVWLVWWWGRSRCTPAPQSLPRPTSPYPRTSSSSRSLSAASPAQETDLSVRFRSDSWIISNHFFLFIINYFLLSCLNHIFIAECCSYPVITCVVSQVGLGIVGFFQWPLERIKVTNRRLIIFQCVACATELIRGVSYLHPISEFEYNCCLMCNSLFC